MNPPELADLLILTRRAGCAVIEVFHRKEIVASRKADNSPVTIADKASHRIICEGLAELDSRPVISEEADIPPWSTRKKWREYWLIDPLDGTKEFIKGNGEFTINIALIRDGEPVFGIVYVPVTDVFYFGVKAVGAFRQEGLDGSPRPIRCAAVPAADDPWRVLGSRSHSSAQLAKFLVRLPRHHLRPVGSSLKLCLVAEGEADLYPRFGPTSEWDTAAAQAVLEAAGGHVLDWKTLSPLRYNTKESVLNPSFIACASLSLVWSGVQQHPARAPGPKGAVIWFTGLSGAGKSTTAEALRNHLLGQGYAVVHLDGDQMRKGICADLGYTLIDRAENVRRIAELAKLLAHQGVFVLVSAISPIQQDRRRARELVEPFTFIEVYISTPLSVCEARDPKGLYKSARAGEIRNFTGIDSPYEQPAQPEVTLDAGSISTSEAVSILDAHLRSLEILAKRTGVE